MGTIKQTPHKVSLSAETFGHNPEHSVSYVNVTQSISFPIKGFHLPINALAE
jgi:hypothetical protein